MSHLNLETLARLVDDAPAPEEKAHLEACAACRRELEDLRADLVVLQSMPALEPPPSEWQDIEDRLAAEGLLRRPHQRPGWRATLLRAAASVAIFLLGGTAGAAWMMQRPTEFVAGVQETNQPALAIDRQVRGPATALRGGDVQAAPRALAGPARSRPIRPGQPQVVDNVLAAALINGRLPQTRDEAAMFLGEAEALYLSALARVSELGAAETGDPMVRVAALEGITAITRAALERAPADVVLNGYHISAIAQREAALRQIAAVAGGSWF
jgi:hypothetical protein